MHHQGRGEREREKGAQRKVGVEKGERTNEEELELVDSVSDDENAVHGGGGGGGGDDVARTAVATYLSTFYAGL